MVFIILQDAAPKAAAHLLLTPLRPPPIRDVGFTLLKNASERVSEILRENRRRLDAGEDPNTIRSTSQVAQIWNIRIVISHPSLFFVTRGRTSKTRHGAFRCS